MAFIRGSSIGGGGGGSAEITVCAWKEIVTIQASVKLTPELQRATPILEVAFGEMGVALAYFTCSLHANQQVIGVGPNNNKILPCFRFKNQLLLYYSVIFWYNT